MKILFKLSGDLVYNREVLNEIKKESYNNKVRLIYGFGTIFSKALNESKIPFQYNGGIRETTEKGLKIGLRISNKIKEDLEKELGRNISLISPIKKEKNKIININADEMVIKECKNYEKIIVYTLSGRDKSKLKDVPNLEVRKIDA